MAMSHPVSSRLCRRGRMIEERLWMTPSKQNFLTQYGRFISEHIDTVASWMRPTYLCSNENMIIVWSTEDDRQAQSPTSLKRLFSTGEEKLFFFNEMTFQSKYHAEGKLTNTNQNTLLFCVCFLLIEKMNIKMGPWASKGRPGRSLRFSKNKFKIILNVFHQY